MTRSNPRFSPEVLLEFCSSCLKKAGLAATDAQVTSENLIFANLRGVDSHGIIRLKIYTDRIRAGGFNAQAKPFVVSEGPAVALIDGENGLGQVAGVTAMNLAIRKATDAGAAFTAVRNGNHFGAAAFYALKAIDHGLIGVAATNAGPTMAPTGGCEPRLGNNPVAITLPAGKHPPVVLDLATGAVAWGKIFVAQQEGRKIPETWALDKHGIPTDDPNAAADHGLIQPFGGYKGYGLSFLIDALTGLLSGGGFSTYVHTLYQKLESPANVAHSFAAIRIESFMPLPKFRERMDAMIDLMHTCAVASNGGRIYVPGEIEHETERRRRTEGIPLNPPLMAELGHLAMELDVPPLPEAR
ncbi:MAG: Ldh family oxidoreductase [Verrucomicrobia bacterium]|nr:Ldh family oxidoreductase [Verrucomicrobiota bacterium]